MDATNLGLFQHQCGQRDLYAADSLTGLCYPCSDSASFTANKAICQKDQSAKFYQKKYSETKVPADAIASHIEGRDFYWKITLIEFDINSEDLDEFFPGALAPRILDNFIVAMQFLGLGLTQMPLRKSWI